jgi:hypothetical protein
MGKGVALALSVGVQCGVGLAQESHVGLTGTVRSSFVSGAMHGCVRDAINDPVPLPPDSVIRYCDCYANALADRLSAGELNAIQAMRPRDQDAAMRPSKQAASRSCTASVLHNQPPKSN